ncbi:MAG: hypothetical protein M1411_05215, partial [Candidatus Thermoplasmatota archaeon]|nr:hypothetical protein [Candidatus Thermoplasmatota archaeon]
LRSIPILPIIFESFDGLPERFESLRPANPFFRKMLIQFSTLFGLFSMTFRRLVWTHSISNKEESMKPVIILRIIVASYLFYDILFHNIRCCEFLHNIDN